MFAGRADSLKPLAAFRTDSYLDSATFLIVFKANAVGVASSDCDEWHRGRGRYSDPGEPARMTLFTCPSVAEYDQARESRGLSTDPGHGHHDRSNETYGNGMMRHEAVDMMEK